MTAGYTSIGNEPTTEPPDDLEDQSHAIQNGQSRLPREDQPLLRAPELESWSPPLGFWWIEAAIMANVFLYGFDTTITAATYAVISSDFDTANIASWLTTSYLVTSTAFQPLYGRFSDIFGRRACFFVSTVTFAFGCLGCGVAGSILLLNLMRALCGFGGGGLMTMGLSKLVSFLSSPFYFIVTISLIYSPYQLLTQKSLLATIVNSDMIPFRKRGMYQALQNGMFGFGAVCGASFGGLIADHIGWRWCFLLQVPVSAVALVLGFFVIQNQTGGFDIRPGLLAIWAKIDVAGSLLLVTAISLQLVGLSLGGNDLPWDDHRVIGSLVVSVVIFALFVAVEARTAAIPIIPLRMLHGRLPVLVQFANFCVGLAAYAVSGQFVLLVTAFLRHKRQNLYRLLSTFLCYLCSSK
jgi:MFS family permease